MHTNLRVPAPGVAAPGLLCYWSSEHLGDAQQVTRCLTQQMHPDPSVPRRPVMIVFGDSHCGVIWKALRAATSGHMTVAAMCRSATAFRVTASGGPPVGSHDVPTWWFPTLIAGLREHLHPGDVVTIMNFKSIQNYDWLAGTILPQVIHPTGASLLLLGDNARFNDGGAPGAGRDAPSRHGCAT